LIEEIKEYGVEIKTKTEGDETKIKTIQKISIFK
jgi:hypothetical protein